MNNALWILRSILLCFLASVALPPHLVLGQVNGNASISAPVFGQTLTISTSNKFAGAISSLTWNNKQFVDTVGMSDFGREFQTAAQFFGSGECYNPTEAGSWHDGYVGAPFSSSYLHSLNVYGTTLETETQMAWWVSLDDLSLPNPPTGNCFPGPRPPDSNRLSPYQVHKTVTIGFAGLSNVIEYKTRVWIPGSVTQVQVNPVAAFMPYEFASVFTYDHVSKNYRNIRALGGEDEFVKVRTTANGSHALAFYNPELLQPYGSENSGYWWGVDPTPSWPTAFFGGVSRFPSFNGPGHVYHSSYFVIGSKAQVKTGLASLHYHFRALDPDVFNWRDYVAMQGFGGWMTTINSAADHWVNHGISEGRTASKTFSPQQYLQLNVDVANAIGATNYQGAIDHYIAQGRSEGRSTVTKAACGIYHTLGYTNRKAKGSGWNGYGQLGNGTLTNTPLPGAISSLDNSFTEIAAGSYNSLAVKANGTLWMWGANQWGARGNGTVGGNITTPVQVPIPALMMTPTRGWRHAVAMGFDVTAAVDTEGYVWTWGSNYWGGLGDGTTTNRYTPGRVLRNPNDGGGYLTGIVSVAACSGTMAAIDADEMVWTWGQGNNGALGNNTTVNSSYPVQVLTAPETPLVGVMQVACGSSGFCLALTRSGKVYGWGSNSNSQLGTAAGGNKLVATLVPVPSSNVIAAGAYHGIAAAKNGKVYGWGSNDRGQLGRGTTSTAQLPLAMVQPAAMNDVIDLAAGYYFSVMINRDRKVFVTGDNQYGQLGIGNQTTQYSPVLSNF